MDKLNDKWRETLTPKEKYKLLLDASKKEPATSANIDINVKPPWFDQERYERAQVLVSDVYYPSMSLSSFTGLLITMQTPEILDALLRTGKSRTVPDLLYRYADTAKYIKSWYESKNIFDPSDAGAKNIRLVRGMHERIFKLMNSDNETQAKNAEQVTCDNSNTSTDRLVNSNVGSGQLRVNQFDMAMTQFSFIGPILLYPEKCGAHTASDQDLLDMSYYWRILAYLLGVEDTYNLCTYDDINKQREFLILIFDRVKSLIGNKRHPIGVAMSEGVCFAMQELVQDFDFNILDHWWRPELSISGDDQPKPLTLAQRYKSFKFGFIMNYLLTISPMLPYFSRKYKERFEKFDANRKKNAERVAKIYGHLKYQ